MSDTAGPTRDRSSAAGQPIGIPTPQEVWQPSSHTEPPVRRRSPMRGPRLLVFAVVIVVAVIVIVVARHKSNGTPVAGLHPGDCIVAPAGRFTGITVVSCSKPHTGEVYAIGTVTGTVDAAADPNQNPEVIRVCRTDVDPKIAIRIASALQAEDGQVGFLIGSDRTGPLACYVQTSSRTGSFVASPDPA